MLQNSKILRGLRDEGNHIDGRRDQRKRQEEKPLTEVSWKPNEGSVSIHPSPLK